MYFIILTTAATLHAHGVTKIAMARQAAEALRPLAGDAAYLLFTTGLIGTGMLGVPVLAGSSAFAISEAMAWGHVRPQAERDTEVLCSAGGCDGARGGAQLQGLCSWRPKHELEVEGRRQHSGAKQPSFQASADVISDWGFNRRPFFPRAAKNVLMANREAGNENRADGPAGSICCFTPVLPTEGGRRQEGKGSSSPSMTKSEPGKAWSSLPTHNAVQGSCRLPCFAEHKGMLNHP